MSLQSHRTADPAALEEALGPVVGPVDVKASRRRGFEAELRVGRLSRVGLFSLRMNATAIRVAPGRPYVALTLPLSGAFEVREAGRYSGYRTGVAHLLEPGTSFDVRSVSAVSSHSLALVIDRSLVETHLRASGGADAGELLLRSPRLSTANGPSAGLLRYLRFVWRELQRESTPLRIPRLAREAEEMLAAMFVEAYLFADPQQRVRSGDGHAAALRRAEEFLAAQIESPVSLAEVAKLAGVSTKTLTRIFRKQHGVGPMAFLRRQRLEAVRRDLLAAERGEVTVTGVALRYGFDHHGRFAASYREAFGELPSETLSR